MELSFMSLYRVWGRILVRRILKSNTLLDLYKMSKIIKANYPVLAFIVEGYT